MEIRKDARDKADKQAEKARPATKEEKQLWYSMFQGYAEAKGHKEGSIAHKYKEKFGVWPVNMKRDQPMDPNPECWSYIQHLNIKSSKRKK
jgi:hypothetical protein